MFVMAGLFHRIILAFVSAFSLSASKPMFDFLASLSIILTVFGILASVASDSCQDCRSQFIRAELSMIGVRDTYLVMKASAMYAQSGRFFLGLRNFFIHIVCIASSRVSIFGMFKPPLFLGAVVAFHSIYPFGLLSHRKFLICEFILVRISFGMPFTVARKRALDCISAFRSSSFPLYEGCVFDHESITSFCFSSIVYHCGRVSISLPIRAPSVRMEAPSGMIVTSFSMELWGLSPMHRVFITFCLKFFVPIGRYSVFSRLNFAVDAQQNVFMIRFSACRSSCSVK